MNGNVRNMSITGLPKASRLSLCGCKEKSAAEGKVLFAVRIVKCNFFLTNASLENKSVRVICFRAALAARIVRKSC